MAGTGRTPDADHRAFADGPGGPDGTAEFAEPGGLAIDGAGNLLVADYGNRRIRKIDTSGYVTTLSGNGTAGIADGTGGPNGTASFSGLQAVAISHDGRIYVSDSSVIRRLDAEGNATTFVGGPMGFADGTRDVARFYLLGGLATDQAGTLFVADNCRIRSVDPHGNVTTVAGTGRCASVDGPRGVAELNYPSGIAVDDEGVLFVTEFSNRIRKIAKDGTVTSIVATGHANDSCPQAMACAHPGYGIAVDHEGNIFVSYCSRIDMISPSGEQTTIAGNGACGFADGCGGHDGAAQFFWPRQLAIDANQNIYVADAENHRIRVILRK